MVSRRIEALSQAVQGFLEAEGYDVSTRPGNLLVGSRRTFGEVDEFTYVWVLSADPRTLAALEPDLLARFAAAGEAHPRAQRFLVADSLEGLSTEFRHGALRWHDVRIRTPIQFFDTGFRWEESPSTASAVRELRNRGNDRIAHRIAQPYRSRGSHGSDLLDELLARLHDSNGPAIHIIVGPAGIGKSHLFEAVFSKIHDEFIRFKGQQRYPIARPFALLPEHLKTAEAPAVRSILRAYLNTELARPLTPTVFDWMLTHGLALWMLDGLDEIISRDSDFFEHLLDLLTKPGSTPPKIVLCLRESLLATNEGLQTFLDDTAEFINLYELDKWEATSKRAFANLRLPKQSAEFMSILQENKGLYDLASTPYYANLMAELFENDKLSPDTDELSLLEDAIGNIITRDYEKGFLDPSVISQESVVELIEAVAEDDLYRGFIGVPVDNVREFAELLLPTDISEDDRRAFIEQMINLAVFTRGQDGDLQFSQEILGHYLIGKALTRRFPDASSFIAGLDLRWFSPDWVTGQVLTRHIVDSRSFEELRGRAMQASNRPLAFRNITQLLSNAVTGSSQKLALDLSNKDLTGLRFQGIDLNGESLIGSDLTDVAFYNCNLQKVRFEDAILNRTVFSSGNAQFLKGADFGQLNRFYSIVAHERELKEHRAAKRWIDAITGVTRSAVDPCQAAMQLRHLVGKFVRPDGMARRSHLDERGAVAGRRLLDPKQTLAAAIRHGYFTTDHLGRIHRPEGDRYAELIRYVTRLDLSSGIRQVLADTCEERDCIHVPRQ